MKRRATGGDVVRTVGRVVLWLAVALVFVRGIGSFVDDRAGAEPGRPVASTADRSLADDAEAGAFAVSFARAYFTFSPGREEWIPVALRPYLAEGLRDDAGLEIPEEGPDQVVEQATVARTQAVDRSHALVTVATTVSNAVVTTRYLTVPVARDRTGGLAVYDYPSLAPPPARADVESPPVESVPAEERAAMEELLDEFFPVFFGGDTAALDYFLPAGTHMRALPERYAFRELRTVAQARGGRGARRVALAVVQVEDRDSGATHVLRYRVTLERRERWYVAGVNSA